MAVIASSDIRMEPGHDAAEPISPVARSKKMALACHALNDEVGRGKIRVRAGGRHEADGLSA